MTATSSTGLYQYAARPSDRLCVDCVLDIIVANERMTTRDWMAAVIGDLDAECCDSCDCVPAADGKMLDLSRAIV